MTDDPTEPTSGDNLPGVRATAAKCVRCGEPVQARYRPFCSRRCADIDLGSWFTGRYRVATDEGPENQDGPEGGTEPEKP